MDISVVINVVKEELEYLPTALKSVHSWADELVVIDMECGEEIEQMAKKYNARVVSRKREPCVEIARNFGISQAKGEWVLILDPDEQVPELLKNKLSQIIANHEFDYVRMPRKNIIFGKWMQHSRWWPDYNIRFFRNGYVEWDEKIHSIPLTKGVGTDLAAEEGLAIKHLHYKSISQYLMRHDRYTSQLLERLQEDGYVFNWQDLIIKPSNEFLSRYFSGEGYKDGIHGLALSLLQSFVELVVYLKAWEAEKFVAKELNSTQIESVFRKSQKDLAWWLADLFRKKQQLTKYLIWKLKQKLI